MAVSPTPDESYYREIAQSYADAELAILAQIRARLLKGAGLDTQAWATARLAELQQLRGEALATLRQVNSGASAQIHSTITDAYADGGQSALSDAREYLPERPSAVTSAARRASVQAVAREVAEGTATAQSGVLRQVEDQYRAVVRSVVATVASGGMDRRAATGKALQDALGAGLKTGPDGRMSLESYVAMATRTGVAKAMIQGHLDTMAANGLDLVYIHPGPRPCDRCDGWGNQILWRTSGPAGIVAVESVTTGEPVQVQVAGSLDQARTDGWGHPNCRCSVGAYLPGATDLPKEREPWDQEGYEAQQRQREIERHIRDWKRKAALATTPEEYDRAQAKVEQWQGAMRDWMESHPALKRQYSREGGGGYRQNIPTPSPKTTAGAPPLQDVVAGKASVADVYEGRTFGKYTIQTNGINTADMRVMDSSGKQVGTVTRTFGRDNNGDWYVYHDLMKLDPEARGQGFSTQFSQFSEDWYRESGITYIRVHAALENGPYAWARAGYAWDADRYQPDLFSGKSEPPRIGSRLKQLRLDLEMGLNPEIAKYAYPGLDVDAVDRAKLDKWVEAFDSGDMASWPTPQDLVNDPTGAALFRTPVGVDWYGRKDLK